MYEKQNCSQRLINHPWHVGPGANRRFLLLMVEQAHRALTHHRTDDSGPDMPTAQYNTQRMLQTKSPLRRARWVGFLTCSPSEKPAYCGRKAREKGGGAGAKPAKIVSNWE